MTSKHTPDVHTRNQQLNSYLSEMTGDDAALLGHLAIYNISTPAPVDREELRTWFAELDLDTRFLPPPPRELDAFEKATSSARQVYPVGGTRHRNHGAQGQTVTLMMRSVHRGETRVVRHLVRELADHENEALSYEVRLAEVEFVRSSDPTAPDGAGTLDITRHTDVIGDLHSSEQRAIGALLRGIEQDYDHRARYISADRLRKLTRDYIELQLCAVRIHQGVYFVARHYEEQLAALRELVARFDGSLTRIPLPNTAEQRQMVDGAFESKAGKDLQSLAHDIAKIASADPKPYQVRHLHKRYEAVRDAAANYQSTLDTQLTSTEATLELVQAQMASLWVTLGSTTDDDTTTTDPT